jgi:hypothetical protein
MASVLLIPPARSEVSLITFQLALALAMVSLIAFQLAPALAMVSLVVSWVLLGRMVRVEARTMVLGGLSVLGSKGSEEYDPEENVPDMYSPDVEYPGGYASGGKVGIW